VYQPSVKVTGAVNSPGSVLWEQGKSLEYYLGAAGGVTFRADEKRVSVKFANGAIQSRYHSAFGSDPKPGPGSEVFVPVKDTVHTNWLATAAAIAQIVTSAIAIVVLIKQL
jgi:protein involved in polysaccharide export with SLBB domain